MAHVGLVAQDRGQMSVLLRYLRLASLTEAVSYLLLMGIAMPLKYAWGMPLAVQIMGMIHGVLFLILIWLLVRTGFESTWPKSRLWLLALASLVPLVPFFLDRRVRGWIAATEAA
jgi:integral membrane protein